MNQVKYGSYEYYYNFIKRNFEETPEPRRSLSLISMIYASLCTCIVGDNGDIKSEFINCTKAYRTFYDEYLASIGI